MTEKDKNKTIDLLKASAGSGKTYRLSHYYIDLLMEAENDDAYRHILAVTFTNKATDEMKRRILKDLFKLSTEEKESPERRKKAARILGKILHDYSAFGVSTIDKFFQKTLRAFARELGQMASYQVELDKEMLCDKAVDTILDELNMLDPDDNNFIEYLLESVRDSLNEGKGLNVEKSLKEMAKRLKSEEFSVAASRLGMDFENAYSTAELSKLKDAGKKITNAFKDGLRCRAESICRDSFSAGVMVEDYSGGAKSSWFRKIERMANGSIEALNEDKALNPDKWFAAKNASLLECVRSAIEGKIADLVDFYNKGINLYNTVSIMLNNLCGLGVAARLYKTFNRILNEENLLCLDESNTLLSEIINGSDAPFVYEKTGVRLEHFLLDEFQDTSVTQWVNFAPLLEESKSNGHRNLIVGDVKQSIYRWRNSDWKLLDSGVEARFPNDVLRDGLNSNYRSFQAIMDFNNNFYLKAAKKVDEKIAPAISFLGDVRTVSAIYNDVVQILGKDEKEKVSPKAGKGKVDVTFCQDKEQELERIVEVVKRERANGFHYGDIAVLVRCNDDGAAVASRLVAEGIEVITEAALSIKSSLTVRRMVSLMYCVNTPAGRKDTLGSFIADQLGLKEIPQTYHNLTDLCDKLYVTLADTFPDDCKADVTYVTAFMDYVLDYSVANGDNLGEFLKKWEDVDPSIQSPLDCEAVKILSIHKSKGLDFPYVVLPFVESISLFRPSRMWCAPDPSSLAGSDLEKMTPRLYDVNLSSKTEGTGFERYYYMEQYNQGIDAINLMYVATTRAACGMEIIAKDTNGTSNFAGILKSEWEEGKYKYSSFLPLKDEKKDNDKPEPTALEYCIHPLNGRLSIRPYARDFFTCADASFNEIPFRNRGTVLHEILSRVIKPSDLDASVKQSVNDGTIGEEDAASVSAFLASRIASHPEFFPTDSAARILNETNVIDADGREYRADRVIVRQDGSVLVLDYKFGSPKKEYIEQIEEYKTIFEQMGHTSVEAHLWFVYQNKID